MDAETGAQTKLEKATITLADCLACSGCITSAETVLIEQQSSATLRNVFQSKRLEVQEGYPDRIVVSLQLQPVISLANKSGLTVEETTAALASYFKSLGADRVYDLKTAHDICLLEHVKEFVEKYRAERQTDSKKHSTSFPILTSSCPGWVCYAEKTHGSWILPYVSRVKSAQQIMGSLLKRSTQVWCVVTGAFLVIFAFKCWNRNFGLSCRIRKVLNWAHNSPICNECQTQ